MDAAAVARDFFRQHVEANPEEGSTLGLREHASRLSDPSEAAARVELANLRATLHAAEAIDVRALPDALRLDVDATLRVARFHERYLARDRQAENLELAAFPNGAMQHAALHARDAEDHAAVIARAKAVPAFLDAHRANLRRGIAEGRAPSRPVAIAFAERVLPGAATATETLVPSGVLPPDVARAASDAFRAFARFVADELVPIAPPLTRLGAEETAFRLRDVMGIDASIDELLGAARAALADAHARMMQSARVSTLEACRAPLLALLADTPKAMDDALAGYRHAIDAATTLVKERALVPVPDDLALALAPLPPGMADGAALTNWSAPLLDRAGKGHALYAPDPSAHPNVAMKQLAIHECIPGHYLQSVVWQRRLADAPEHAVRFLGVVDDVAMSRGYFGTMVSVEGWAVAMETLLGAQGFFDPDETFFHAWCNAVHAVRVLLDLELHAGDRDGDGLAAMVAGGTLLSPAWASNQVVRSLRIPLQSSTYMIGASEIHALRHASESGREASPLAFYEALLGFGPVPVSRVKLPASLPPR